MATSSRRLKVLHVIQNLNYGGMEKLMADLVRTLDHDRFEPHVLTLKYLGRYSRDMTPYAEVHLAPPMSRLSLIRPASLAGFLRDFAPDVVHTHSGVWYKTAMAARMAGVPRIVHTEHGKQPEGFLPRWLDQRAARRTDVIVAVSEPLRGYMAERLKLPAERIEVVINGVDTSIFVPKPPSGALRKELGLSPEQPIIGSIGRLEAVKGYENVIKAFALLPSADPAPVLVIAGEGAARPELEALIRELGVAGRVFLLGWRDDGLELLPHFSCFAMGSWSEGTSVSLLEAMASGLAPVVTAVGGNLDVLGPDLRDQAVPAGDVAALAQRLERVLIPAVAREIGAKARHQVETNFGLAAMVSSYQRLYAGS
jgi:glycosyltransferase involved in cell wall biosynthesis